MRVITAITFGVAALFFGTVNAFAPPSRTFVANSNHIYPSYIQNQGQSYIEQNLPIGLQRQRRSMSSVATMSLFGLGGPEIAIILVAAAFLLGPQKLAELGKDAGKIAGELKEVPKEFQKGFEDGEENAKAQRAKEMPEP